MAVTVYAPASMGNVSVGFDLLGAALAPVDGSLLGDRVSVAAADQGLSLRCCGAYADVLPPDPASNIVLRCAERFIERLGLEGVGLQLTLEKNLPIGSGLGSSASSVVAGLAALNAYFDSPLDDQALLHLMGELEGEISGSVHYDNVAPSFLGGLQLMLPERAQPVPSFDNWYWVVAYPGITLSTAKMRALLPKQVEMATAIRFGQQLAAFIDACHRQDEETALAMLQDVLAEPHRAAHIPGYQAARGHLSDLGCAAVGISGSGPTLFAVARNRTQAEAAAEYLGQHYIMNERGLVRVCQLPQQGIQIWQEDVINAAL
ncbi:homoserine kinase [Ferrimonas balearica]|uniref:homoserine kinase n=1 Tax=Ferrimonas balearica TaxID=44012 RepID=UPI001C59082D|nr:homoserine kinase [Ferrimonas balearica]MBW3165242.1 homoserine kinase [Ferrimonas balearica]